MSKDDDNGRAESEWPPKRSGRRKIPEARPTPSEAAETSGSEPPPSERLKLPGGIELDAVMRKAIDADPAPPSVDVLRGVQDRLRERSGGKFYADGWSTTRHPPFGTFFVTSLMMIAIVAIIYATLVPLVGEPVELPKEPSPVNVLPR